MKINNYFRKLINRMEKHGYYFNEYDSYRGYYCFRNELTFLPLWFETQKEIAEYLKNCVFDD